MTKAAWEWWSGCSRMSPIIRQKLLQLIFSSIMSNKSVFANNDVRSELYSFPDVIMNGSSWRHQRTQPAEQSEPEPQCSMLVRFASSSVEVSTWTRTVRVFESESRKRVLPSERMKLKRLQVLLLKCFSSNCKWISAKWWIYRNMWRKGRESVDLCPNWAKVKSE